LLCSRIEQLLVPQAHLCTIACPDAVERAAQRYYAKMVGRASSQDSVSASAGVNVGDLPVIATAASLPLASAVPAAGDFHAIDIDSREVLQPRSVGVEHVALHAIAQLGIVELLTKLDINGVDRACILGNLIGRMAAPASERATWQWLHSQSALGELLDVDYESLSHMRLYRASDALMKVHDGLENHVFNRVSSLFSFGETVTLYDLTNTYFEGEASANPKAQFDRSKEKRSDCPLVTLGLVLDGSGFVRRSRTFDGNVSEGKTLEVMFKGLQAQPGALVIMDADTATQANIDWLIEHKYRYLAVRRGGVSMFDDTQSSVSTKTMGDETVRLQKVLNQDGKELALYCHSQGREAKERAMVDRLCVLFEAGLQKMADGLKDDKPRSEKRLAKLQERIGRLKEKCRGIGRHYQINLEGDEAGKRATALTWKKEMVQVRLQRILVCIVCERMSWVGMRKSYGRRMWTDIESVFRSLKSELGLRPVFHHKENRVDGHLFMTVLAYQCVQVIRTKLKEAGIHDSWATLRQTLKVQQRVTVTMRTQENRMVHVRKSTKAEPNLTRLYTALGIDAAPGGIKKLVT